MIASIINTASIILTVFAVIHILGSAALGLRKSWKHSLISFCRDLIAVLLAFITAKLITAPIGSAFGSLIFGESLNEGFETMPTLLGFISGIPGALLMPFIFVLLFWIYTLLLLIPQIFVKKALLKDEIAAKKAKEKSDISWKSRFISAGIKFANAFIILLVVMLPLSCLLSFVSDVYPTLTQTAAAPEEEEFTDTNNESESVDIYEEFIAPLWKAYNESPSRVAMTDWFDTVSSRICSFKHRSVQGGLFIRLLDEAWAEKRK